MIKLNKIPSDKVGIISSLLCLIHCLAIPLIFGFSAEALHAIHHDYPVIDYIFAVISLIAAYFSIRKTDKTALKIGFIFGWILFILGVIMHGNHIMVWSLHLGTLILIITHLVNLRTCRVPLDSKTNS